MKICAAQTLISFILCGVSVAHSNYAQILDKQITLELDDVPFDTALKRIERAANVKFAFSISQLQDESPVTMQAAHRSLRKVLDEILKPRKIMYRVHEQERTITLKKSIEEQPNAHPRSKNQAETDPILPVLRITGLVTDAGTKQPMAGVNIVVRGTTRGTTSDSDGRFTIEADNGDVLVFSFIGYRPFEIRLSGQSHVEVALQEDITSLNEVVVNAGYYTVTRETQTGNIVRIGGDEIENQPVSNTLSTLQGRVAGLEITQQTGVPGGNFQVRIRGTNSIANGNDPLYIIDGVPFISATMAFDETSFNILGAGTSPLNALSPNDIESIEVLKDADATAVYGSRASNGVILITTRRGTEGATKVDFSIYKGIGQAASRIELLNTTQYLAMRREAYKNMGIWPLAPTDHKFVPDLFVWDTTRYTDWQNELIGGTAHTLNAQIRASGGDQYTRFSVGVGYNEEGTVFPGRNKDRRISTIITLNNASKDQKLTTTLALKYSVNDTDLIKTDLTTLALTLPPVAPPIYSEDGELNWSAGTWTQFFPNPLSYTKQEYESVTTNLLINSTIAYSVLPNLELKSNLGYSSVRMKALTTVPKSSLAPSLAANEQNQAAFSNSDFNNWTIEPQVSWNQALGRSYFNVLIGTTFLEQIHDGLAQHAFGFSSEALMKNIGASASRTTATNYYSQYRYHALFGRINYVFNERYVINLTGRRDGSSRFGTGKQFSNFGAIGAAWIFSKAGFVKDAMPALSFGKLRISYGITGNDQLKNYEYLDAYRPSGNYHGVVALTPTRLSNPDFRWETNKKFETGLEVGILKDRVSASVSFYNNRSSDQLVGFALPPTAGFNSVQGNLPAVVQNAGWEVTISSSNVEKNNFRWITSGNLSFPRNELLKFPNLESSPGYATTLEIGKPINIAKVYSYVGVDPQTGLYQFEDVNGDGAINTLDRKSVEFVGQRYFGGIMNRFQFKNVELEILLQFVKQERRNYLNVFSSIPGGTSNQPAWVLERWRNPGDESSTQLFTIASSGNAAYANLINSTRAISDASYVRLKNVALSYSLPNRFLGKVRMNLAKVFIQAQNLLTFTSFEGLDPETGSNSLPPLKVIAGGINLTF